MALIPTTLIKGETITLSVPASAGAVSASLKIGGAGQFFTVNATQSAGLWHASKDSADMTAGYYGYELWEEFADGRKKISWQETFELADAVSTDSPGLSKAEEIVEKIDSFFAGDPTVASYTINGRSLSRYPVKDLLELKNYYAIEAGRARRKARGLPYPGPRISFRF